MAGNSDNWDTISQKKGVAWLESCRDANTFFQEI